MSRAAEQPKTGTLTIEWLVGSDPTDASTYGWQIRAEPALPEELVAALLTAIGMVN